MNDIVKTSQPLIVQYLDKYQSQIAEELPNNMSSKRMARIIKTEIAKTPKLLEWSPRSLFGSVVPCAQVGLEPGGILGHAWLLPYWNSKKQLMESQLMIGYRGMIDIALRSSKVLSIEARSVYEGDYFDYEFGLSPTLNHKPLQEGDRGHITHVYAVARMANGPAQFDVMSHEEVEKIRLSSQNGKSDYSPWAKYYDEMAKKTVIRKLFKYLPVSIEMNTAVGLDEMEAADISQDNAAVIDIDVDYEEVQPEEGGSDPEQTKSDEIIKKIEGA